MAAEEHDDLDAVDLEWIARYASGDLDAQQARDLEARAQTSPVLAAELALARAFRDADSGAAGVGEIAARLAVPARRDSVLPFELARPRGTRSTPSLAAPWGRTLRLAAMLAMAIGAGVLVGRLSEPPALPPGPGGAVRGSGLDIVQPLGRVAVAPAELVWQPLPGLATRVRVESTSGEVLLDQRIEAGVGTLQLPPALTERLAGGLRWRWTIEAIDAEDRVVGRTEPVEVWLERSP